MLWMHAHHFYKGTISAAMMKELFGDPYRNHGHQGYAWVGCKEVYVVRRIESLHPILDQHPHDLIPPYMKTRFPKGVAMESKKGKGFVN